MGEYKRIRIGVESFAEMRENNYHYVDKTLLIKELLDLGGKVTLFTRPRRFGKTLNMTMLREFFQTPADESAAEKQRAMFEGLKIMEAGDKYTSQMGQYPVIFLSLKSAKQPDWELAYKMLAREIYHEFQRCAKLSESVLFSEAERERFVRILVDKGDRTDYVDALRFLSECLQKACGRRVVILIDEYDVPLENAYFRGFYEEMVDFIRSLFESALKTNDAVEFAVLTGCLRISKESIFTGLNNLKITSVTSAEFSEHFGFTPEEVEAMLKYYGKENHLETVRKWYDGYLFGNQEVYNPWSVLNYLSGVLADDRALPRPYWANTSSNDIVRTLVEKADDTVRDELEELIAGGTIEKPVHEDITYGEIDQSQDNLWNFLFFTGYLRKVSERLVGEDSVYMTMRLPNLEVRSIYKRTILGWFDAQVKQADLSGLYRATLSGDAATMEEEIGRMLFESISYLDSREAFYHGFVAGLYKGMDRYLVESNRESGDGRPDLLLRGRSGRQRMVVLELKAAESLSGLEESCEEALEQIRKRGYCQGLRVEGYKDVIAYGIAFYRKDCAVRLLEE